MSLIADYGLVLLLLACLFGFFMAWGVGANDVAMKKPKRQASSSNTRP